MNNQLIPLWIQALGTLLTIPSVVWGIFLLFRKDHEKEKKIQALSKIANSQNALLIETQKQVTELQKQSQCLLNANELMKEQIEIQLETLLNDKEYKDCRIQFEKMKRINSIKPNFTICSSGFNSEELNIHSKNIGKKAFDFKIIEIESENISGFNKNVLEVVDTNREIKISGKRQQKENGVWPKNHAKLKMDYYDEDKNHYEQEIIVNKKAVISEPKLLELLTK